MLYDLKIEIIDKLYLDSLIVALVRQGYDVYIGDDKTLHINIYDSDLTKITLEKIMHK